MSKLLGITIAAARVSRASKSKGLLTRCPATFSTTSDAQAEKPKLSGPGYSKRLKGFDAPTVWQEFTPLANANKAINLGQGFPDWKTPDFVKAAMNESVMSDFNQYSRSAGDTELVDTLAAHYGPLVNRKINPLSEVAVGVGATEVLFAVMQSLLDKGDEVVVLEPAFDTYPAQVQMAGGKSVFVPLNLDKKNRKWTLDTNRLEKAITKKTKILLLNTPHNPSGKVLTRQELDDIAAILRRHLHVTAVMDEVYEKLVYDGREHVRLASLPGMWDRCITVSSSGKTFSCTGWKVGWAIGSADLIKPIILANQWIQYCVSTPTQRAISSVIKKSDLPYEGFDNYYQYICAEYQRKRDFLVKALEAANLAPVIPDAGFFVIADTSKHSFPERFLLEPGPSGESPVTRDWAFCRWLTVEVGVTPIPPSAFYIPKTKHLAKNMARFAFCKTDEYLAEGQKRLLTLSNKEVKK